MNLIELENLVKGAPDEYLVKEVQQPSGKVPPFLALSEIQRRKDMRDRYMAQTNEGPKPTIAEQLTGGIGSMGGAQPPQGASVPTPSATGIPSVGAPPIASGAAPMPTPPGIPQGFATGGLVGYADGGVTPLGSQVRSGTPYLDAMNAPPMQYSVAQGGLGDIPMAVQPAPVAPAPAPLPEYKNMYNMTPAQVKLAQMLSDPNSAKVPDAINYDELIAQAGQSKKDIREQARKDAIGAALVKLGAGLAAGNMGVGLGAAGEAVSDIMRQGRTEASAERRLAQQLTMQAKEGQRQQAMQEFQLSRDNQLALATMESDSQAKAEERAYRSQQAAASAANAAAQLQLARARGELDNKQFELGKFTTAQELITKNAIALTGPRPDKSEMTEFQNAVKAYERYKVKNGEKVDATGRVVSKPINPEEVWTRTYIGNLAQQAQIVAPKFDFSPAVFSPAPAAAPAGATPPVAPAGLAKAPPDNAIAALKKNPTMKADFDRKYGQGMADRYLK
jgi:hypothetical protein